MINVNITFFKQPIGDFALGKMSAADIIKIMTTNPRTYDQTTFKAKGGPQRELSPRRLKEIADYAASDDACFPTAVILALPGNPNDDIYNEASSAVSQNAEEWYWRFVEDTILEINDTVSDFALLVDGQHRMFGLKQAGESIYSRFDIPVVFLFNPTLEHQAIIFSIINEKQTKVSFSLVAQLFGLMNKRSPETVAHSIAASFNSRGDSPFYQRVKMLGKKTSKDLNETLSQGTIVRQLQPFFEENNKNNIFRDLYDENTKEATEFILKVLLNYFGAAKDVWPGEWSSNDYILTKTVGFTGLMRALPYVYTSIDKKDKNFVQERFKEIFIEVNKRLLEENETLTSNNFPSSGAGASKFKKIIEESTKIVLE